MVICAAPCRMPWKKHRNEVDECVEKLSLALLALGLMLCAACSEKPASQQTETLPPMQCEEEIAFTLAGDGTEENPYQIAALEDLMQFAAVMNANNAYADYANCHFLLTADIDLNDVSAYDTSCECLDTHWLLSQLHRRVRWKRTHDPRHRSGSLRGRIWPRDG